VGTNDMNHMQHLESVALSDCAVLEGKEATYQGSWKRAGGRSAWFMARRNLDRLITMMKPPPAFSMEGLEDMVCGVQNMARGIGPGPEAREATVRMVERARDHVLAEDLFGMIARNPKGEDGTVLACMRDARRYFMLVEAEMIAEGVVEPEARTYETESYPVDVYQMIADEKNISREEVKTRIHELFYGKDVDVAAVLKSYEPPPPGAVGPKGVECPGAVGNGGYAAEQAARHREPQPTKELSNDDPILAGGMVYEKGKAPRFPLPEDLAKLNGGPSALSTMRPIGTPEDGGQHASLVPWEINETYYATLVARVGADTVNAFYNNRALNVWRLEPIVDGKTKCPREINDCYEWWTHGLSVDTKLNLWVLRRSKVPADLADQFPLLQREMNTFEFEQSPQEFRFMYIYTGDSSQKWVLATSFDAWARET
jgi:uncharacterized protein YfkK (UPF0435 family)